LRFVTAELEARVLADPDDDGPRLVVADWWQHHQDPRGVFVQSQIEVAHREPDVAWARARARSERLRTLVQPVQLRELQDLCGQIARVRYERGFVEHIDVVFPHDPDGTFLAGVAQRFPVRSVSFVFDGLPDLPTLLANAERAGIRRLGLEPAAGFGELAPRSLGFLEALELPRAGFGTLQAAARAWVPGRLRRLSLRRGALDRVSIRALAPALAELGTLDLTSVGADPTTVTRLARASTDVPLALSLAGNTALRDRDAAWVETLLGWRPLTALDLRAGAANEAAQRRLFERGDLGGLTALGVSGPFTRRRPLLGDLSLPRLRRLAMGPIGGPPLAQEVAEAPDLHRLVSLDLGGNRIRDVGLISLLQAPFDRLVDLDLHDNSLTDESLFRLAAWSGLENVVRLRLGHNPDFTAAGWRALIAAEHFRPALLEVGTPIRLTSRLWDELVERFGDGVVEHAPSLDRPVWELP